MLLFLIKIKSIVLDILFPPICLNCHKTSANAENNADLREKLICKDCLSLIKLNNTLFCPICRSRLAENKKICRHSYYYNDGDNNGKNKKRSFYYFLAAAGNYDDPILQNLIHYFKYRSFESIAPILGEIIIKYLSNLSFVRCQMSYVVVPIPLHSNRERERGFNQAKLLAEIIARHFNLPIINSLKRIKNNEPQAKIKGLEKRAENISGCFKIDPHANFDIGVKNSIKGKNIILVDDVFTSGATINEAVKILKESGAKKIIALVLAKT